MKVLVYLSTIFGDNQPKDEYQVKIFAAQKLGFRPENQPSSVLNPISWKQAGTGPSRRHIQGSKIAKRVPSVKYSCTVVENQKFFEIFF